MRVVVAQGRVDYTLSRIEKFQVRMVHKMGIMGDIENMMVLGIEDDRYSHRDFPSNLDSMVDFEVIEFTIENKVFEDSMIDIGDKVAHQDLECSDLVSSMVVFQEYRNAPF